MMTRSPFARLAFLILIGSFIASLVAAQEIKRIPPPGVQVPPADRQQLEAGTNELEQQIVSLRDKYKSNSAMLDLLPDVQIYYNAVHYALKYDEFFTPRDIPAGKKLLTEGLDRAKSLMAGEAPWTKASGLVVR